MQIALGKWNHNVFFAQTLFHLKTQIGFNINDALELIAPEMEFKHDSRIAKFNQPHKGTWCFKHAGMPGGAGRQRLLHQPGITSISYAHSYFIANECIAVAQVNHIFDRDF